MKKLIAAYLCLFSPAFAAGGPCEDVTWLDQSYTICEVQADADLRLFHSDADGEVMGHFSTINNKLPDGQALGFAMNAGMYHDDYSPVGLYIEGGEEKSALASGGGFGNFGLTPNGVFCINEMLNVIETNTFRENNLSCEYATQSGPMLVIDGALHPRLLPDGTSKHIRNGVGTSADGQRAVFAISNERVNFYDFATLFRDYLNLPNALYFDGKVSRLYNGTTGRSDFGFSVGAIVGTVVSP
ncbi:phosphodiester glycosidase family protein [Halocynthiibacter styelae]|uniref:Phosphodiester glycosidase family protein n=1 Tax=Halocynthiibacter styelae TaxID=2761955 RepID=A0A8J7LW16_9RHOB|nr:phosphodiester glycosidase family protein [Paenihalocynthiibacter styelae]MBI1493777.1 phosphodiester glycosidase family protein [Paenihalocynthiibacter styelae]